MQHKVIYIIDKLIHIKSKIMIEASEKAKMCMSFAMLVRDTTLFAVID